MWDQNQKKIRAVDPGIPCGLFNWHCDLELWVGSFAAVLLHGLLHPMWVLWSDSNGASPMCSQEEYPKASTIQATFDQRVGQLAEASENYHREGVSFVRGLLDPNPSTRMTAEEALAHPFLTGSFPEVPPCLVPTKVERPPPILKTTMDRWLWEACGKLCNEE
jgi:serine/threonine protein kinase